MNSFNTPSRNVLAISAAFLLSSGAAFAQEATPDTWTKIQTSATVESVRADMKAAHQAGDVRYGEVTRHGVNATAQAPLSREQVQAEAREAMRLGLTSSGEGPDRVATAQELRAVQAAGLRAVGDRVALQQK